MPHPLAGRSGSLRPLCLALLALGATGTRAETSPYYIGVSQAFSHSSNLFNSPDGQETPDVYSTTRLLFGLDQPIGRQRIYGDAAIRADKYQDVTSLDNTGYSLNTGLDWATVEKWSGNLKVTANRSLAQYGGPNSPQITGKNVQDTQQASFTIRNALTAHVSAEGDAQHRAVKYSAPQYVNREYTQNIGGLTLRYATTNLITLGAGARVTKGNYPQALIGDQPDSVSRKDETDRRDFDLTLSWIPSGLSNITARISATKEEHSQPSFADVSGLTGQIGWIYQPTGKLTFNTSLSRDTGTETTFMSFTGEGSPSAVDNNRLTNSAALGVTYDLTAKIRVTAGGRYSKTSSENTTTEVDDSARGASLGVRWIPTRSLSLGCNAALDKRTSTSITAGSAYTTNTAGCSAQLTLR